MLIFPLQIQRYLIPALAFTKRMESHGNQTNSALALINGPQNLVINAGVLLRSCLGLSISPVFDGPKVEKEETSRAKSEHIEEFGRI